MKGKKMMYQSEGYDKEENNDKEVVFINRALSCLFWLIFFISPVIMFFLVS